MIHLFEKWHQTKMYLQYISLKILQKKEYIENIKKEQLKTSLGL